MCDDGCMDAGLCGLSGCQSLRSHGPRRTPTSPTMPTFHEAVVYQVCEDIYDARLRWLEHGLCKRTGAERVAELLDKAHIMPE